MHRLILYGTDTSLPPTLTESAILRFNLFQSKGKSGTSELIKAWGERAQTEGVQNETSQKMIHKQIKVYLVFKHMMLRPISSMW